MKIIEKVTKNKRLKMVTVWNGQEWLWVIVPQKKFIFWWFDNNWWEEGYDTIDNVMKIVKGIKDGIHRKKHRNN